MEKKTKKTTSAKHACDGGAMADNFISSLAELAWLTRLSRVICDGGANYEV